MFDWKIQGVALIDLVCHEVGKLMEGRKERRNNWLLKLEPAMIFS